MSVPFATRVAVRSETEPRQLGPLAFPEVLYRALSAPRPQRMIVTPEDESGVFYVCVAGQSLMALTEGAEEDLALALLRDGVISVDGLMRARRRSDKENCTLVEGLLLEELAPVPDLRDRAQAATKLVMEGLFALHSGAVEIEEGDDASAELFLRVKPDQFVVDFVRRAVTPLRARKVLGEVGDRFRLAGDADDRIGLCGFLAEERDVIEEFRGGGPLTELLLAREEGGHVAPQAVFAGLAIGLLEPDDGVDLWEDIEIPDTSPDERGFAVPGFSKFAGGAQDVRKGEPTVEIEVKSESKSPVESKPETKPEPKPKPKAEPAPIPEEPESPAVEEVHLLEDVVEKGEERAAEAPAIPLEPAPLFGEQSLLDTRTEEAQRPVVRPKPTPPGARPAATPPMRDLTDLVARPRTPKKTPVTREIPILDLPDPVREGATVPAHQPGAAPFVTAPPVQLAAPRRNEMGERLRWAVGGGGVVLLSIAMGWTFARVPQQATVATPTAPTATPTQVVMATPPPTATPTPEIEVATPEPTPSRTPRPVDPATLKRRQAAQMFAAAKAAHQAGRVSEAVDKFERAAELDPGNARIHAHLALALYDLDDLAGAEQTARKAVKLNASEPWGYLALANVQQAQGQNQQAIQSYDHFLKLNPRGAMAKDVRQIVEMLRTAP